jgi:DNA polymerase IV
LKKLTESELIKHFGKTGRFFYKIVRGNDDREVQPDRETKSLGAEDTFPYDLTTLEEMYEELDKIGQILFDRMERYGLKGRTVTLKIKYHDFRLSTRSQSFPHPVSDRDVVIGTARQLLSSTDPENKKIRLLGISISNFGDGVTRPPREERGDQLKLF